MKPTIFTNRIGSSDFDSVTPTVAQSRNDQIDNVPAETHEHILLGRGIAQDDGAGDASAQRTPGLDLDRLMPDDARVTGPEAPIPPKPLEVDAGGISVAFDPVKTYILGTSDHDNIHGTDNADVIYGLAGNDDIQGFGGNDFIWGGDGIDNLSGQNGDDALHGGNDNDMLFGGQGNDALYGDSGDDQLHGNDGADILMGGSGQDALDGGADDDSLNGGEGNDQINGGGGQDSLRGTSGNDNLYGGWGDDDLQGGDDHDYLSGDEGHDVLDGGAGFDILEGGSGNDMLSGGANADGVPWGDYLTGGAGADMFWFELGESGGAAASEDVVWDFASGEDVLVMATGEANTTFLGEAGGFMGDTGAQAWYEHVNSEGFGAATLVHVRDGNGTGSDIDVLLVGHIDLTADDMMFG